MCCVWIFVCLVAAYIVIDYIIRRPRIPGFNTKHILVTGCDSGFGQQLAKQLDILGCHVYAGCLTEQGVTPLREECSNRVKVFLLDITNKESIQAAFDLVSELVPDEGLWGLVNNAGILPGLGPLDWLDVNDFQQTMDVNGFGTIRMSLTFMSLLKRGGGGRVVNMSSIAGRTIPGSISAPYNISKWVVEAFSDSLRLHFLKRGDNVTVHVLQPGAYLTNLNCGEWHKLILERTFHRAPQHIQQEYGQAYLDKLTRSMEHISLTMSSTNLNEVVDTYVHALSAWRPRKRYSVGRFAKYFIVPLSYAPSWLTDYLFTKLL